jgi:hypothetical protein
MRFRFTTAVILVAAAVTMAAARASTRPADSAGLTVHEWGTFTSIAGEDGGAVQWLPQAGPTDLPCFVRHSPYMIKGNLMGTVRMETPVLYFYAPRDVTVSVKVGFRQGRITEWFPDASVGNYIQNGSGYDGAIAWPEVNVLPRLPAAFPTEPGPSHYYKARNTDASPIQSAGQAEKFLFYRGVGQFAPPIAARVQADGKTAVWTPGDASIGDVIMFENRRGAIAYEVHHVTGARVTLERPSPEDAASTPQRELVRILVAHGLYQKEAEAMVDTWSDSWFEEGARLLYIAPRAAVDAIVPLTITPAPSAVARVFVGRMELVTPATRRDVRLALATNDRARLDKYGRFLQPIGDRVLAEVSPLDRALISQRLQAAAYAYSSWAVPAPGCR